MKILVDGRPAFGGIARYTQELIRILRADIGPQQVDVYREHQAMDPRGVERSTMRRAVGVIGGRARRVFGDHLGLALEARRIGASVIHCPSGVAAAGGVPVVITCHDLSLVDRFAGYKPGPMKYYERHGLLRSLESAAHVITPSETVAAQLHQRFDLAADRVTAIPPPLADLVTVGHGTLPPTLAAFILAVGVLEPRKNLAGHRAAWSRLGVPLVLIGPYGWRQRSVLNAVEESDGRVRWLGAVDDATLAEAYRRAAVVVQYSDEEGFDYPAAEALSFGTPLILSDIPVHREVARECASYADPADPNALADRLCQVLSWTAEQQAAHAQRACARAAEIRAHGAASAYLRVYRHVEEQHRRSSRPGVTSA